MSTEREEARPQTATQTSNEAAPGRRILSQIKFRSERAPGHDNNGSIFDLVHDHLRGPHNEEAPLRGGICPKEMGARA